MRARTHANPFAIRHDFKDSDIRCIQGQPLDIEIGFGRGVFLRYWAQAYPERHIVGVEVRNTMVEGLQDRVDVLGLLNVQLFHGNGQVLCDEALLSCSVNRVFVFHPDPWFKNRHRKRRVINANFLRVLAPKMKLGGRVYVSTDVLELFNDMQEAFVVSGCFEAVEDPQFWENDYKTHWDRFSERDERQRFCQAFEVRT